MKGPGARNSLSTAKSRGSGLWRAEDRNFDGTPSAKLREALAGPRPPVKHPSRELFEQEHPPPPAGALLTSEAAARLGVQAQTIAKLVKRGALTPVQRWPGARGRMWFDPADIDRIADERRQEAERRAANHARAAQRTAPARSGQKRPQPKRYETGRVTGKRIVIARARWRRGVQLIEAGKREKADAVRELRARGMSWPAVAYALDISPELARRYGQLGPVARQRDL